MMGIDVGDQIFYAVIDQSVGVSPGKTVDVGSDRHAGRLYSVFSAKRRTIVERTVQVFPVQKFREMQIPRGQFEPTRADRPKKFPPPPAPNREWCS